MYLTKTVIFNGYSFPFDQELNRKQISDLKQAMGVLLWARLDTIGPVLLPNALVPALPEMPIYVIHAKGKKTKGRYIYFLANIRHYNRYFDYPKMLRKQKVK